MTESQLFTVYSAVQPEWIDYNGHMNMGYYRGFRRGWH